MWRQDEQAGLSFALKLTAAGARAIAIHDSSASAGRREGADQGIPRSLQPAPWSLRPLPTFLEPPQACPRPEAARSWRTVLELLQRDCGATLEELIAATDWLPHTTRAALTGLRKRGYAVTIDRARQGARIDVPRAVGRDHRC